MTEIHDRMVLIQGEEELWAERVLIEKRRDQENAKQLYQIQAQLADEQFSCHFSSEARQQAYQWEMSERAAYDARLRSAESRFCQQVAQDRLNLETTTGQKFVTLRQGLHDGNRIWRYR